MVMNISCKFEKASYNIFFVRAVTANNNMNISCKFEKASYNIFFLLE